MATALLRVSSSFPDPEPLLPGTHEGARAGGWRSHVRAPETSAQTVRVSSSHVVAFFWPKQVTRPNLTVGWGRIFLPWEGPAHPPGTGRMFGARGRRRSAQLSPPCGPAIEPLRPAFPDQVFTLSQGHSPCLLFSFFPFYCCCSNSKNNTFFHCNVFQSESNPSSPLRASHPRSNHCQLFRVYHFRYFPCLHTHVGYVHVNMILGKLDLPARMHIIL